MLTRTYSNVKDEQLKLRKTGRIAIAGLAIAATLSMTACGGDDNKDTAKPARTTTSAKAAASASPNLPPVPTVSELNTALQKALDPSIPNAEKLDMVQGAQADPELPNRLADAAKSANIQVAVTEVTPSVTASTPRRTSPSTARPISSTCLSSPKTASGRSRRPGPAPC